MSGQITKASANLTELRKLVAALPAEGCKICIWAGDLDPDSIGSALGVYSLLIHIFGNERFEKIDILHARNNYDEQNQTMATQLSVPLVSINDVGEAGSISSRYSAFIFVDCVPREKWSKELSPLMVVDHHKDTCAKSSIEDIRNCGACCSIIAEYLCAEGYDFGRNDESQNVATALFFGIINDTHTFADEATSDIDIKSMSLVAPHIVKEKLKNIMSFDYSDTFFETRRHMEQPEHHFRTGKYFVGFAGYLAEQQQSSLYMMVDERLRDPAVEHAVVCGIVGGNIRIHVRSKGSMDVDRFCKSIFGKQYGGGKRGAGRAEFPMAEFAIHPGRAASFSAGVNFVWTMLQERLTQIITGK